MGLRPCRSLSFPQTGVARNCPMAKVETIKAANIAEAPKFCATKMNGGNTRPKPMLLKTMTKKRMAMKWTITAGYCRPAEKARTIR